MVDVNSSDEAIAAAQRGEPAIRISKFNDSDSLRAKMDQLGYRCSEEPSVPTNVYALRTEQEAAALRELQDTEVTGSP